MTRIIKSSPILVQPASTTYRVHIPTRAVPKGRPRFSMQGGHPRAYSPKPTVTYENWVRLCCVEQCGTPCMSGPIRVRVEVVVAIPAGMRRADKIEAHAGRLMPSGGGDLDNLVKGILDAVIGIAFKDDRQIVELLAVKRYGPEPCAVLEWGQMAPGGHGAALL